MSKSEENPKGVIFLLDEENVIRKKIMGATTDSEMSIKFDFDNKPGISNLINIYASLTGDTIDLKFDIYNMNDEFLEDLILTRAVNILDIEI